MMISKWMSVRWAAGWLAMAALGGCVPESGEVAERGTGVAEEAISILPGYDLTNTPATVELGANATSDFVAPAGHAATDWVGLYQAGGSQYLAWSYVGAATSGAVSVRMPPAAVEGQTYELRYFLDNGFTQAAASTTFVASASSVYDLSNDPSFPSPGSNVAIDWAAPANHSTTDWIGLYPAGGGLGSYVGWTYVGAAGATSGTSSVLLPSNVTPGSAFEFRYFKNNTYELAATSDGFVVGAGLTAPAGPVPPGSTINSTWTTSASHATTDWIGLFPVAASNSGYVGWSYVGNAGATTGTVAIVLPANAVEGDLYELRYFVNNTYQLAGRSSSFAVGQGYAVVGPTGTVAPGDTVAGDWTAPTSHATTDWIGLYAVGAAPAALITYAYVGSANATSGSVSIPVPSSTASGAYELRYHTNNTYNVVATSDPFQVGMPTITSLVTGIPTVTNMATDGANIFFGSGGHASSFYVDGSVQSIPIGGGTPTVLVSGYPTITGLALDGSNVLFTSVGPGSDFSQGFAARVAKTGGPVDIFAPNQAYCMWIVNDAGTYYWAAAGTQPAQWADGAVRSSVGGAAPTTVADEVDAVDVTVADGYIYWIGFGSPASDWTDGVLRRRPVGGGAIETLATNLVEPGTITVAGGRVYIGTEHGIDVVDPASPGVVSSFLASPDHVAQIVSDGVDLYWTETAGRVARKPLGVGNLRTLATGLNGPFAIFLHGGSVFVGIRGTGADDGGIVRLSF